MVFDCDGVILNSNRVKTQAFYLTAKVYGETAAQALVDYHINNGGVSRYKKFSYFLENIVPHAKHDTTLETLVETYAGHVQDGLLDCEVAPGLHELRKKATNTRWLIVSGGDQAELRKIFAQRDLTKLFDGGIFGSPDTKDEILSRELSRGNILQQAIFLGDSKYDHQAATAAGLDFIFISGWSEVNNWKSWCQSQKIQETPYISCLLD